MTAKEIIQYVKDKTTKVIEIQVKNKSGIIKKAIEILDIYNNKHAKKMEKEVDSLGQGADTTIVDSMTAKEIIEHIMNTYNVDLSFITLKNKKKIIKEAKEIITAHHIMDIESFAETKVEEILEEVEKTKEVPAQPEIELSTKSRKELIQIVKDKFNERVGGLLVSDSKVAAKAAEYFRKAGYIVK